MPAAVCEDKTDRDELMRNALRAHILRERERQKQEREAEVEEERLRKEREAREQQDVMTLGETREQIKSLEAKLQQLKEEKHQLFLQLKKVLNEDDNRRRQLVKESSELIGIQAIPSSGLVHQQIFLPQSVPRVSTMPQISFKTISKRARSPSPPPPQPTTVYHQGYSYKSPAVGTTAYPNSPQKNPQYPNQPAPYYSVAPQEIPLYYPQGPLPARDAVRPVYDNTRNQSYHLEQKSVEHYALRPQVQHGHVMHVATVSANPAQGLPKTPTLGATYPVRAQTQYQPVPAAAAPSALYTTQSRPFGNASIAYPPRE